MASATRSLFDLAPDGVCLAGPVTCSAGGLLHHRFTLTPAHECAETTCFLLHCSVGSPRLGVTQHRALWSSDFPRTICDGPRLPSLVGYRLHYTIFPPVCTLLLARFAGLPKPVSLRYNGEHSSEEGDARMHNHPRQATSHRALRAWSLTLACLACACAYAATPNPMPTTTPTGTPTQRKMRTPTTSPTLSPSPTATETPTPRPTDLGQADAFDVAYFPWVDESAAAQAYVGEGRARIINSIFFSGPPFFGFDTHPPEGWYHVRGDGQWATLNGERISPIIKPCAQPGDGDQVLLHGRIVGNWVTASYVGYPDGPFYYYRSLLHSDELRSGLLPQAYDGLDVWVRGTLDATEGLGAFYALPDGTSFPDPYLGLEGLVGGRLSHGEETRVQVVQGIYVREGSRHVQILAGALPESHKEVYEEGRIRSWDAGQGQLIMDGCGGELAIRVGEGTRILFADGTGADASELMPGRRITVEGELSPAGGHTAVKVTIVGTITTGSVRAAYISRDTGELWSVGLTEDDRRQVTHLGYAEPGLAAAEVSPNGRRFAFARNDNGRYSLVVGDLESGQLREWLTDDGWSETDPAWSPDGARIVIGRHQAAGAQAESGSLWILNLTDGSARQVTEPSPEGWRIVQPRWSPDGRFIAYGLIGESAAEMPQLFVVTLPSQVQKVFEHGGDWRWSPDATQILSTRQTPEESRARLWVLQRDGSSPTWLSPEGVHDLAGRWSPDSSAIAFLSHPAGSDEPSHLWIMQADGTRRFRPESRPMASRLAWSPDSETVIFLRTSGTDQTSGLWRVYRDGSGLRQLAAEASALVGTYREP